MNRVISYIGIVKKRVLFFRAFLGKGKLWMYHIRGLFCLVKLSYKASSHITLHFS